MRSLKKSPKTVNFFLFPLSLFLVGLPVQMVVSEEVRSQSVQNGKSEVDKLLELGNQQIDKNQFQEAIQTLERAVKIYRQDKNLAGVSNALRRLGVAYFSLKDNQKAIAYFVT